MKNTRATWIGLLVTLSALTIPNKTIASPTNSVSESKSQSIESRLARIAKTLQQRENQLSESSQAQEIINGKRISEIAGWLKGGGGGFVNRGGGGGFVNRRWPDGGGFFNRRY